ncbi:MAG: hypothetical protein Q7S22_04035 [Candidatus Micrarchaeota archaeon]|nr:hypothetical protein [Candidatus Micrarchaeota archaeon]
MSLMTKLFGSRVSTSNSTSRSSRQASRNKFALGAFALLTAVGCGDSSTIKQSNSARADAGSTVSPDDGEFRDADSQTDATSRRNPTFMCVGNTLNYCEEETCKNPHEVIACPEDTTCNARIGRCDANEVDSGLRDAGSRTDGGRTGDAGHETRDAGDAGSTTSTDGGTVADGGTSSTGNCETKTIEFNCNTPSIVPDVDWLTARGYMNYSCSYFASRNFCEPDIGIRRPISGSSGAHESFAVLFTNLRNSIASLSVSYIGMNTNGMGAVSVEDAINTSLNFASSSCERTRTLTFQGSELINPSNGLNVAADGDFTISLTSESNISYHSSYITISEMTVTYCYQ